jgi:hypothetical protein
MISGKEAFHRTWQRCQPCVLAIASGDGAFDGEGDIGAVCKMVLLDSSNKMFYVDDHVSRLGNDDDDEEAQKRCEAYKFHAYEDMVALIQNAGFALPLPTIDIDTVAIYYPNVAILMEQLQRMGKEMHRYRERKDQSWCLFGSFLPL